MSGMKLVIQIERYPSNVCKKTFNAVMFSCVVAMLVLLSNVCADKDRHNSVKFEKDETFQDIFSLTQHNFSNRVLKNEEPWIVLFHFGTIKRSWKSLAVSLRGVISFGMIDINTEFKLTDKLKYDNQNGKEARVYPFGSKSIKQKGVLETSNVNEAKLKAINSIPNYILDIKYMGIDDFIVDSFMSIPSRFPLIILTDSLDIPPLFKILALRLERHYNFGYLVNPIMSDLQKLGIEDIYLDMPSIIVLTTETANLNNPQFMAIQYKKSTLGDITYTNVLKFLININRKFRHQLPGENMSNDQDEVEMREVVEHESERFDILDEHDVHTNVISDSDYIIDDGLGSKLSDEL